MPTPFQCLECGAPLTPADTGGVCPKCLLKLGLASQLASGSLPATAKGLRDDGTIEEPFDFGGYRILRLLGKGGMGAVYEAEQFGSGRRVALKVLGQTLDTPEMHARFVREGQLAAAVRHPNVVAVLGAEEIEGTPVIIMELLHDGTLKDRVKQRGPLPVPEAVDAVLRIIDGLEAAHAVGVLHRDVKPANCFSAATGEVKVGDFGLSISTLAKAEHSLTQSGAVLGTPAFAAPEQLRGGEIDARADIYAVGATLYYLLTGKPTHDAETLIALIAAVLEQKPADVRTLRADIPRGLAQTVMRCLEKDRARRFPDYASLRAALEPFSSVAPAPGMIGLRFIAGVVDSSIAALPELVALVTTADSLEAIWLTQRTATSFIPWVLGVVWAIAYFAVQEGLWGTTLGKTLCGLRVAGVNGEPIRADAALLRAMVFNVGIIIAPLYAFIAYSAVRYRQSVAAGEFLFSDLLMAILCFGLFVTMRRRNGYAAIHDLISRSRVVSASSAEAGAPVANFETNALPAKIDGPRIGVFTVAVRHEGMIEAADDVLRRRVWIVPQPAGAPELSVVRRDLARAGRLRWLQSRRSPEENWDAFEAPAGRTLASLADGQQPWSRVRRWLLDLAEECSAGLRDGTQPQEIGVDRVWITADNRAVLLDFPGPATPPTPPIAVRDASSLQGFLAGIAKSALTPMQPLHARTLLETLGAGRLEAPEIVAGNLRATLSKPATVSARRRLFTLTLGPLVALLTALLICGVVAVEMRHFDTWWQKNHPQVPSLRRALEIRSEMASTEKVVEALGPYGEGARDEMGIQPEIVRALDVHLAGHFAAVAGDGFWSQPEVQRASWPNADDMRGLLRKAVKEHSAVTREELRAADQLLESRFSKWERIDSKLGRLIMVGSFFGFLGLGAVVSFVWAVFAGSPVGLRLFGLSLVRRDGRRASRLRAALRVAIAWLPTMGALVVVGMIVFAEQLTAGTALALAIFAAIQFAALIHAFCRPTRSLADLLAGTTIVPR